MARTPVESLLLDYKRSPNRWIGVELERLLISKDDRVLNYEPEIRQCLERLRDQKGWRVEASSKE